MRRTHQALPSLLTLLLLVVLQATHAEARTLLVGPLRTYTTLQQVAGLLEPGDTVLVDGAATYPGGVNFTRPGTPSARILIRGVAVNNTRPTINGGTNAVAFIDGADHYTFENFIVQGATFRGIYHQSDDLVLRGVVIAQCRNGIMGADNGSGSLLLEYSELHDNGEGTQAHQIYMATDEQAHPGSVFRMQFCRVYDGTGGNNVKSRAERNEIYYNWIEGARYHELELIGPDPAGGVPAALKREDSDVVGNVLWKKTTPSGGVADFYVVRFGGDGTGASGGRYRFVNNTVIMGTSATFRLFDLLESVEMHNNVFHLPGGGSSPLVRTAEAVWTGGEVIAGQNNWVHSGLTAVPAQWTGTLSGLDPGFEDSGNSDLAPAAGSPLKNEGAADPSSPPGHPFPSPLFPPSFHPPVGAPPAPGGSAPRPADSMIDIGAFEATPATDAGPEAMIPRTTVMDQNYPNPFNPSTTIGFGIAERGRVRVGVYDVLGREVSVLLDEWKEPGRYSVRWDAGRAAAGVYIYRLTSHVSVEARRMSLIK